jgi:hypothetical protein
MIYLVGGTPTPLKNMSSPVGVMTFPRYGKKHVPKHQPVIYLYTLFTISCSYVSEISLAPHLPAIAIRAKEV